MNFSTNDYQQKYSKQNPKPNLDSLSKYQKELKIKPVYTHDPLPESLLFEGYERYLVPIPSIGYEDKHHASKTLSAHFIQMNTTITESIKKLDKIKVESEESIDKWRKWLEDNANPSKLTLNHINQNFWRLRVFMKPKEIKCSIKLKTILMEKYTRSIDILMKLKKIAEELVNYPRYFGFVTKSISGLIKISCYKYQHRLKAIKLFLNDVSSAMHLLPHYFSDEATGRETCIRLIESMKKNFDKETLYLIETEDYYTFLDYIRSKNSPLRIGKALFDYELKERITNSKLLIQKATGIKDQDSLFILGSICFRYWIEREAYFERFYNEINPNLSFVFESYKSKNWEELKLPRAISDLFIDYHSIEEFFNSSKKLAVTESMLFECIFESNPNNILRAIYDISSIFSRFISESLSLNPKHRIVLIGSDFLWKILFIHSNVPGIDGMFNFINYFSHFKYISKKLFCYTESPLRILSRFVEEAKNLYIN